MLKDIALEYYRNQNYNCAETIMRAGNDYYNLGLHDHELKMVGVFGGGIQTGNVCGTVLSAASILSMKYIEQKAHDSADIKPVTIKMLQAFKAQMGGLLCKEIKPVYFSPETRCQKTIEEACMIIEQVIDAYEKERK